MVKRTLILIPAYRCAASLRELIPALRSLSECTILVVDDGSNDETAETARISGAETIIHNVNLGKGAALESGYNYALDKGFEFVITLDGDGQHSPDDLAHFLDYDADFVLGSREFKTGSMPFFRICSNRTTSFILRWVTGKNISDSQCGYRKVRLSMLTSFKPRLTGFQYETELLLHVLKRRNGSVVNVPIRTIYADEKSYIRHFRDTWQFIYTVLRYLWISR